MDETQKYKYLIPSVRSLKDKIHQDAQNGHYEQKQAEKNWGYFMNDLINNGIEYTVDFVQYIKEKGIKLTNNTDLIDLISNELPEEQKITKRQNRKGNIVLKNIYINSKCLHHPEKMTEILCRYIKSKCNDEDEEILKTEIKEKIDDIERKRKVGYQKIDFMNYDDDDDDLYDEPKSDPFDNYFFL